MIRGLWNRETVAAVLLAAHLPIVVMWIAYGGADTLFRFGLAALVIGVWHLVFLLVRAQAPSLSAVLAALAIALLTPEGNVRRFPPLTKAAAAAEVLHAAGELLDA